jgi:hypothetical protein
MLSNDAGFWQGDRFRFGAFALAALVLGAGLYMRFDYDVPMPPPPARPKPDPATLRSLDFTANMYRALVEKDALDFGVPVPAPADLEQVFPYDVADPRQVLTPGGPPLETRALTMSLRVGHAGALGTDHLILRIENRTDDSVAYRVETRPDGDPRTCMDKNDLPHNAVALAPHEAAERTECTTRNGAVATVTVVRVETLVIPPLSYYYVSRLFPPHIGLDARTTRRHVPPKGAICSDIPEQAIRRALEKGEASWRDVIDFYARESCAKFIFSVGYRAFTVAGEQPLPVPLGKARASQP